MSNIRIFASFLFAMRTLGLPDSNVTLTSNLSILHPILVNLISNVSRHEACNDRSFTASTLSSLALYKIQQMVIPIDIVKHASYIVLKILACFVSEKQKLANFLSLNMLLCASSGTFLHKIFPNLLVRRKYARNYHNSTHLASNFRANEPLPLFSLQNHSSPHSNRSFMWSP